MPNKLPALALVVCLVLSACSQVSPGAPSPTPRDRALILPLDTRRDGEMVFMKEIENTNVNGPTSMDKGKDGKYLAYISNIVYAEGKPYATLDFINWLSYGDGGCLIDDSGTHEGEISQKGKKPFCNPNGFLISNRNPKLRTFEIHLDGSAYLIDYSIIESHGTTSAIFSTDKFVQWFQEERTRKPDLEDLSTAGNLPDRLYMWGLWKDSTPFYFTIKDGVIVEVAQQYVP